MKSQPPNFIKTVFLNIKRPMRSRQMKKIIGFISISFFCSSALSVELSGFAGNYNADNKQPQYQTTKALNSLIKLDGVIIDFEKTKVSDIQSLPGGQIRSDDKKSWVCYHSANENYWFISYSLMQSDYLSTVAISDVPEDVNCDKTNKHIVIETKSPYMGTSLNEVVSYFGIKNNKSNNYIQLFSENTLKDYIQTNTVEYYFKDGKVNGMFISQVTTS
jgi:hypothetical protein